MFKTRLLHLDGLFSPEGFQPGTFIAFKGGDGAGKRTTIAHLYLTLLSEGASVAILSNSDMRSRLDSMIFPPVLNRQGAYAAEYSTIEELSSIVEGWLNSPIQVLLIEGLGREICKTTKDLDKSRGRTVEDQKSRTVLTRERNIYASLFGKIRTRLPGSGKLLVVTLDDYDDTGNKVTYLEPSVSHQLFRSVDAFFSIKGAVIDDGKFKIAIAPARVRSSSLRVNATEATIQLKDAQILKSSVTDIHPKYQRDIRS